VPCGSDRQRYAFLRRPGNVTIGASFHFRSAAAAGRGACRYYSFAALFGACPVCALRSVSAHALLRS